MDAEHEFCVKYYFLKVNTKVQDCAYQNLSRINKLQKSPERRKRLAPPLTQTLLSARAVKTEMVDGALLQTVALAVEACVQWRNRPASTDRCTLGT